MASRNAQLPLFPQTPESDFSLRDLESEIQHIAERIQSSPGSHLHEISELTAQSKGTIQPKSAKKAIIKAKEEVRPYPKISRRSRLLAEKADERFFSKYNIKATPVAVRKQVQVSEPSPKPSTLPTDPIPARAETSTVEIEGMGEAIADPAEPEAAETPQRLSIKERIERYLAAPEDPPARKPRGPSISERSQLWLQRRNEKLRGKTPPECTFSPVIYTKIPHHLHHLSAEHLLEFTIEARKSPFDPRSESRTSLPSSLGFSL
jgi:hypothetical protein